MIREVKLGEILEYEQPNMYIVKNTNYNKKFDTPVLTAGQSFILGYTNEKENIFKAKENPVIIFDDFTTASKYVDFDFKVKSSAMKILKSREGINIKYVYYAMQNIKFDNQLHKRYWISEYSKIKLLIPDIKIQEKIVKELDLVIKVLDYKKKQIKLFDELIKSQFVEMFGDIHLNDKNWKEDILKNNISIIGGYAFKSSGFQKSGIPILRIGNINTGKFRDKDLKFWKEDKLLEKYAIYPKDVLISLTGTVGKEDYGNVCIIGNEYPKYYLNQRNAKLNIESMLSKEYFSYALKEAGIKKRLLRVNRGVRQANISNKDIEELKLPVPPITLQNQFSEIVKQIDKQKFESMIQLKMMEKIYNIINDRRRYV